MLSKRFCRRPWGWWLVLLDRKHFKVKLLWFKARKSCSLQHHNCRNELWLWLWGNGHFYNNYCGPGGAEAGMAIHVPKDHKHQYEAYANTLVLEIQYGDKCIEEDIVRV